MIVVAYGGQKLLTANFFEYQGGPAVDPTDISLVILDPNGDPVDGSPFAYPGDIVRTSLGHFSYTWNVPLDADAGIYVATWTSTIDSVEVTGEESFQVAEEIITSNTLEQEYLLTFAAVLNPLYVDPEELVLLFPEASYLEIAEALHRASLDVQYWLKIPAGQYPTNPIAYDYVKAAAACELSRTYGNTALSPDSNAESITLGDLRVEYSNSVQTNTGSVSRATASTWCELAEALRFDLVYSSVGMKAVVKGSNYPNPIPSRTIKPCCQSRSESYFGQSNSDLLVD